jgi:hypothetical protein
MKYVQIATRDNRHSVYPKVKPIPDAVQHDAVQQWCLWLAWLPVVLLGHLAASCKLLATCKPGASHCPREVPTRDGRWTVDREQRRSQNIRGRLIYHYLSGTIIRGTLKTHNFQLVTPISIKLQRPDGYD